MNVVVGNSIKIETDLNMDTVLFKKRYFNRQAWPKFLFSTISSSVSGNPSNFSSFEYLGRNRLILEDDEFLIDTIITKSSEDKTQLQIVVDVYMDDYDFNDIINNIIENSALMNQ